MAKVVKLSNYNSSSNKSKTDKVFSSSKTVSINKKTSKSLREIHERVLAYCKD